MIFKSAKRFIFRTLYPLGVSMSLFFGSSLVSYADLQIIIPAGPGGGWDTTARATGEALYKSGLEKTVGFENISGGASGTAISSLIRRGNSSRDTILVNSTPIVLNSLSQDLIYSFRDLRPIASVIGDYGAFVVLKDSPYESWLDVAKVLQEDPRALAFAGGSARGSMDHLVAALVVEASGGSATQLKYIPYDGGGQAKFGLISQEVDILSTGLSEAIELVQTGAARILAITAEERNPDFPEVPTIKEFGFDATFVNWRGFFFGPQVSDEKVVFYEELLGELLETEAWEEVRARNGWTNLYYSGEDFIDFLEEQERIMGQLMLDLGFLKALPEHLNQTVDLDPSK